MNRRAHVPTDTDWCLISLRPIGQHDALRRAAARLGARTLAVSPWRLRLRNDPATRTRLEQARACDCLIFTSPTAAAAAARLMPLQRLDAATIVAIGQGTARALLRHGAHAVQVPARMDSEGLLALPAMADLHGKQVALITAPGGRGVIAAQAQAGGARLFTVEVYERQPLRLTAFTLARLQALRPPAALAVSSGQALEQVWKQLPPSLRQRWQRQPTVVASARLAEHVAALGFACIQPSAGPMPSQLAAAAHIALFPSATT